MWISFLCLVMLIHWNNFFGSDQATLWLELRIINLWICNIWCNSWWCFCWRFDGSSVAFDYRPDNTSSQTSKYTGNAFVTNYNWLKCNWSRINFICLIVTGAVTREQSKQMVSKIQRKRLKSTAKGLGTLIEVSGVDIANQKDQIGFSDLMLSRYTNNLTFNLVRMLPKMLEKNFKRFWKVVASVKLQNQQGASFRVGYKREWLMQDCKSSVDLILWIKEKSTNQRKGIFYIPIS